MTATVNHQRGNFLTGRTFSTPLLFGKIYCLIFLQTLRRSSVHCSLGFLVTVGFIAGVIFWGGFNTALEFTNTGRFCISCHGMRDNSYEELKAAVHFSNRSGVRAACPDCHVPHNWTDKLARKMQASRELWETIFGTINSREKFQAQRRSLAEHEWVRLKANDSLECRNCHHFDYMDFTLQSTRAAEQHSTSLASGEKTCIDCHNLNIAPVRYIFVCNRCVYWFLVIFAKIQFVLKAHLLVFNLSCYELNVHALNVAE